MTHIPYTYLIGWSTHNVWYYGVRWAIGCEPNDLLSTYFTSSEHVKNFIALHGNPDVIQIRKTFSNKTTAQKWEYKVLKRLNCVTDNRFLNKAYFSDIGDATGSRWCNDGKSELLSFGDIPNGFSEGRLPQNPSHSSKISYSLKKLKWYNNGYVNKRASECPEGFVPGRLKFKRSPASKETKQKISEANLGQSRHTEESKKRLSETFSKKRWWTNGKESIFQEDCPEGYWSGRIFDRDGDVCGHRHKT